MKKTRHGDERMALALKQAATGMPVAAIRRMRISEQTFHRWKVYGRRGGGKRRRGEGRARDGEAISTPQADLAVASAPELLDLD